MTETMQKTILETERLFLREFTMRDLESLHRIFSDPESMRYYPRPFTLAESKRWIE